MSSVASSPNSLPVFESSRRLDSGSGPIDRRYWVGLALCLLGCLALRSDLPVSQWMHTRQGLKGLHQPLQVVEAFGDGAGAAVLLITLYLVSPRRRELLRLVAAVIASGALTNLVKMCVVRLRPRSYPGEGLLEVSSVFDTFQGWFPLLQSQATSWGSKYQSFPSAHTATGFALAVGLTRLFGCGWWFGFLAVLIGLQRVETGAHYLSDTCFGGALGLLVALSFQGTTPWARWFDAYEQKQKV